MAASKEFIFLTDDKQHSRDIASQTYSWVRHQVCTLFTVGLPVFQAIAKVFFQKCHSSFNQSLLFSPNHMARTTQHKGPWRFKKKHFSPQYSREMKIRMKIPHRCNLSKRSWCWTVGVLTSHVHWNICLLPKLHLGGISKTISKISAAIIQVLFFLHLASYCNFKNTLLFGYRAPGLTIFALYRI